MALVDERLPVATPDDFRVLVAGHLKHQVGQLFEPGPVHLLPIHRQRLQVDRCPSEVLSVHRPRFALPHILALLLLRSQPFRHIKRVRATRSALDHDGLQAFIHAFQPFH